MGGTKQYDSAFTELLLPAGAVTSTGCGIHLPGGKRTLGRLTRCHHTVPRASSSCARPLW